MRELFILICGSAACLSAVLVVSASMLFSRQSRYEEEGESWNQ
jgi:hypothetical protein